jgi:hypothetical protein
VVAEPLSEAGKGGGLVDAADARIVRKKGNTPFVPLIGRASLGDSFRNLRSPVGALRACGLPVLRKPIAPAKQRAALTQLLRG